MHKRLLVVRIFLKYLESLGMKEDIERLRPVYLFDKFIINKKIINVELT